MALTGGGATRRPKKETKTVNKAKVASKPAPKKTKVAKKVKKSKTKVA